MRLCFVTTELTVGIVEADDAPPHVEARECYCVGLPPRVRVFERLSGYSDPVHGIVMYEELPR